MITTNRLASNSKMSNNIAGFGRGRGRFFSQQGSSIGTETSSSNIGDGLSEITEAMSTISLSSLKSTSALVSDQSCAVVPRQGAQSEVVEELLTRPSTGTMGRRIALTANYYELNLDHPFTIHRYDISIIQPGRKGILSRDVCREVFWRAVEEYRELFGDYANLVYDDASCLWTGTKLFMRGNTARIKLMRETSSGRRVGFLIDIKYTMSAAVNATALNDRDRSISMQFLNSLITQSIRCPLREISTFFYPFGRSMYLIPNPERGLGWSVPLGSGAEAWTGLHSTVKVDQNGALLLNADISTSAFYKVRMNIVDFYLEILNEFKGRSLTKRNDLQGYRGIAMDANQRNSLKKALIGLNLGLTYGSKEMQKKNFKFVDVCGPAASTTFLYQDRNNADAERIEITVEEYFARTKDIRLHFPYLPVLQVGPRHKKILIPMELLIISDKAQKVVKELTDFQLAKLIRGASIAPVERRKRIANMIEGQEFERDDFLINYGVSISKNMIHIDGRVLNAPRLELHTATEGADPFYVDVQDGTWPLRNQLTASPNDIMFAAIIVNACVKAKDFYNAYDNLVTACCLFGMQFVTKQPIIAEWNGRDELQPLVKDLVNEAIRQFPIGHLVLLFIMPSKHAPTYAHIKTVCDIYEGVACQVLLAKTFLNMVDCNVETDCAAHHIALKLNVRMGGINNKIHRSYEVWPKFVDKSDPTIFVGIDVTHPRPGRRDGNSFATVVASVDVDAVRYEASVKVQHPDTERVVYVVDALRERLISFYKHSGCTPNHIVIYRDGIAETDFLNTAREELASVMAACKKLDPTYSPTISYVAVQKRHHTRLFVENRADARGSGNVPPGTVVDERIVSPYLFDFFLSSQLGSIGTSRPSHYYVLYDTWKLTADEWQHLTFAMCHLNARCNHSVSIPAPVYYANLACARASAHDADQFPYRYSSTQRSSGEGIGDDSAEELQCIQQKQQALTVSRNTPSMYFI